MRAHGLLRSTDPRAFSLKGRLQGLIFDLKQYSRAGFCADTIYRRRREQSKDSATTREWMRQY